MQLSGVLSLCSIRLLIFWPLASSHLALQDSQLCLLSSGALLHSTWAPPPCALARKLCPGSKLEQLTKGLTSFVSHFPGITVLHCLVASVLRTVVLYILSIFLVVSVETMEFSPYYTFLTGCGNSGLPFIFKLKPRLYT